MDRYEECMADIAIAQEALEQNLPMDAVADCQLLCDVYCLPSHNHQAFYLQVYGGTDYTLLYAKTLITDGRGCDIVMYPFRDALKANERVGLKGDIYCEMQHLPLTDPTITQLLQCLPNVEENCLDEGLSLDGVCTVIRNHLCNPPIALGYFNSYQIEKNDFSYEQAQFLHDLYLHIEEIIGNLLRS